MRTSLSYARGLGSAGEGVTHWWAQRVTSATLVPLALWLGFSLASLGDYSHATVTSWLREPVTVVLLIAFLLIACHHMALGLRVVIEDYVHSAMLKVGLIVTVDFGSFLLALTGIIAALKVFF